MDNPEHSQLWAHDIEGAIKNGQSRALLTLGTRDCRSNQEWTIQSTVNFGYTRLKEQSRMDNPEHCQLWTHEIEGAIKNGQSRDTDKYTLEKTEGTTIKNGQSRALSTLGTRDWRSNQEWTIQRNWKINARENRRDNQECTIQSTVNFRHTILKEQSRKDNPEHCQLWAHEIEGAIKNGQSRALSTLGTRDWRSNQEWTIQRNWKINVRENRRDNQECTIQSTVNFGHTTLKEQSRMDNPEHCQPWAHEIEGAIKNGQSRDTVNFGHTRLKKQSRMDNPEHC